MASESSLWKALRPLLAGLDPQRIESHQTGSGIPDVNYSLGWIELKYLPRWPVRPSTPVRIDHFTDEQRIWLTRRVNSGGRAFLLLKVGNNEWLLFRGDVAARIIGESNREELYAGVTARWTRKPKVQEIQPWLT